MKKTLYPFVFIMLAFVAPLFSDDTIFEGISMTERLLMTNSAAHSYGILQSGTVLDPSCTSLILGGTNGVGKLELEACSIVGIDRAILRAGVTDSIILNYQTGSLTLGNSGAETLQLGIAGKSTTFSTLTGIVAAGANWGTGDLIWSGTGGVLTNAGSFTSVGTITGGNFTWPSATTGSVPFFGASGVLSQDNGSLFWDATNKRLGVGNNSTLLAKIHTVSTNGVDSGIFVDSYSSTASQGSSIVGRRAEGTKASPSAVLSNDLLSSWGGRGFGQTIFTASSRAKIHYLASENWSDTSQGTRIELYTTPNGTTNTTLMLTLNNDSTATFVSTVTMSNLVLSSGSGKINGLTASQILTNVVSTVPYLSWSGQGGNVMTLATNSTPVGVINGGTGTGTQFTTNSVVFAGATGIYTQNLSFVFDPVNNRLGVGTNTPAVTLHVNGTGQFEGGTASVVPVSGTTNLLINGNGGYVQINGGRAITRIVTTTNYTAGIGDYYIAAQPSSASLTVTLPAATALPNGGTYIIADELRSALTTNIFIVRAGADTINAAVTNTISTSGAARTVVGDGSSKWFAY